MNIYATPSWKQLSEFQAHVKSHIIMLLCHITIDVLSYRISSSRILFYSILLRDPGFPSPKSSLLVLAFEAFGISNPAMSLAQRRPSYFWPFHPSVSANTSFSRFVDLNNILKLSICHVRVLLSFQQPTFQHITNNHCYDSHSHFKCFSLFQVNFWNVGCWNDC